MYIGEMPGFNEKVRRYSGAFKAVWINEDYYRKIYSFAELMAEVKVKEHPWDNKGQLQRCLTGLLGEAACEVILKIPIIEWEIGNSERYNHPDISSYGVGIKTVKRGRFPIILKQNGYPQIICFRDTRKDRLIWVCGLATVDVLNECQDDNLMFNPDLKMKGNKTGFYGFDKLVPVRGLKDIEGYCRKI